MNRLRDMDLTDVPLGIFLTDVPLGIFLKDTQRYISQIHISQSIHHLFIYSYLFIYLFIYFFMCFMYTCISYMDFGGFPPCDVVRTRIRRGPRWYLPGTHFTTFCIYKWQYTASLRNILPRLAKNSLALAMEGDAVGYLYLLRGRLDIQKGIFEIQLAG